MAQTQSKEERNRLVDIFFAKPYLRGDRSLWGIIFLLMFTSLMVVYSATNSMAYVKAGGDTAHYFFDQLRSVIIGLCVIYFVHRINYQFFVRLALPIFVLAVILQILTFFIGVNLNDANRSLPIFGFTIQPSDFLKVSLVLLVARMLAARQETITKMYLLPRFLVVEKRRGKRKLEFNPDSKGNMEIFFSNTFPLLFPVVLSSALVLPSNLSTAGIIFASCWIMFYMARMKWGELLRLLIITIVAAVAIVLIMDAFNIGRARTWTSRVKTFFATEQVVQAGATATIDPDEEQAINAKMAIASGGITGKGAGKSTQRARLSHSYSDFAYAFVIEEYGLVGAFFVLMFYLSLFYRTMEISKRCNRATPSLLVPGLGLMIFLQASVNMLVSTGLFFVTGQNLPLISMGGSSVLFISLALGIILSVSRQTQEKSLDESAAEQYQTDSQ